MISKFFNLNSKVNKYVNKVLLNRSQPGYMNDYVETAPSYWDYYLNYLTSARLNGTETNSNTVAEFKSFKSYLPQYVDTRSDSGALTNVNNLLNASITKTMKCPIASTTTSRSGFTMEVKSSYFIGKDRAFNGIVIQLNKLDKAYIDSIKNAAFRFEYTYKVDDANSLTSTNSITKRITFAPNTSVYGVVNDYDVVPDAVETAVVAGNTSSTTVHNMVTNNYNINEGIFVIDSEMLKWFGLDKLSYVNNTTPSTTIHYTFSFYIFLASTPQLEIANVTFTNSFNVYIDDEIKFQRNNLSIYNQSKKTGVVFLDVNEYNKSFETKMSLLTESDAIKFDYNIHKNNMNCPFYFFPYCEASSGLSNIDTANDLSTYRTRLVNTEMGGLYSFDVKYDLTNKTSVDFFDIPIKLNEYK
jgi:hypothetical protein